MGVLLCFCASPPQSMAPVGLSAGARPGHPLHTPGPQAAPNSPCPDHHPCQAETLAGIRAGTWQQLLEDPTLGTIYTSVLTWRPPALQVLGTAVDKAGLCRHGACVLVKVETVNKEARA